MLAQFYMTILDLKCCEEYCCACVSSRDMRWVVEEENKKLQKGQNTSKSAL